MNFLGVSLIGTSLGWQPTLAIFGLGPLEICVVAFIALLLFGRRLPEVARSMGKGVVEFKKGLKDIETDVDNGESNAKSTTSYPAPPAPPPPPAE